MKWMEFECETPLLAEAPETRQHFFLFPDFLFLPVVNSPAALRANASEGAPFSQRAKVCQYFFKDFLETFSEPRIARMKSSDSCAATWTAELCDAEGMSPRSHRLAELTPPFSRSQTW
jgi:hypothetical protein